MDLPQTHSSPISDRRNSNNISEMIDHKQSSTKHAESAPPPSKPHTITKAYATSAPNPISPAKSDMSLFSKEEDIEEDSEEDIEDSVSQLDGYSPVSKSRVNVDSGCESTQDDININNIDISKSIIYNIPRANPLITTPITAAISINTSNQAHTQLLPAHGTAAAAADDTDGNVTSTPDGADVESVSHNINSMDLEDDECYVYISHA